MADRPGPAARQRADEGPQLLAELEGFSGNAGAAKQLLVRLRHDARVKVEVVDGTQVFVWLED